MSNINNENNGSTQNIIQLGHPTLRKIAAPVSNIESEETQQLISSMLSTVKVAGGVGIAAPQIDVSQRIFIVCSKPNDRYPNAPLMEPSAIINPVIIEKSEQTKKDWDGCLSVPSLRGLVPRHTSITVEFFDSKNDKHTQTFNDFVARIFQHEIDHLNGLTFVDRVETPKDLFSEAEWRSQFVNN
jgi:peptide deformylase